MNKFKQETAVGAFVLIAIGCLIYLSVNLGNLSFLGLDDNYRLTARFHNVQGLSEGARVSLAGVPVGSVTAIRLKEDDYVAMVELSLDKTVVVYDDAIASIKTNGLIGDRYVSLTPGGSGIELHSGDLIIDTESALDIESLISKYAFGDVEE